MDVIPTIDARRDRFGYWVWCPYCRSREARPWVHAHYQDCESPKKDRQLHFSHQGSRNIAPTMTAEKTNSMIGMARISISQTTA
jgi:hypothetical protein